MLDEYFSLITYEALKFSEELVFQMVLKLHFSI